MTKYKCPDCKDTGEYRGLIQVGPCKSCNFKPEYTMEWAENTSIGNVDDVEGPRKVFEERYKGRPKQFNISGTETGRMSSKENLTSAEADRRWGRGFSGSGGKPLLTPMPVADKNGIPASVDRKPNQMRMITFNPDDTCKIEGHNDRTHVLEMFGFNFVVLHKYCYRCGTELEAGKGKDDESTSI